jgi:5-oxoprolinase (ATP-hydrolysing)
VGRLNPDVFPKVFGPNGDQPIDSGIVLQKFTALAQEISKATGEQRSPESVAEGFLMIAVANMANAIKEISIQRGYDVTQYTLACFGGAGGQAACRVADALGMTRIFLHPFAGVLSAYGMGLADIRAIRHHTVEAKFEEALMPRLGADIAKLEASAKAEIAAQGIPDDAITVIPQVHLKYAGTDAPLIASFGETTDIISSFETAHRQRYGFVVPDKPVIVDSVSVEAVGHSERVDDPILPMSTRDWAGMDGCPRGTGLDDLTETTWHVGGSGAGGPAGHRPPRRKRCVIGEGVGVRVASCCRCSGIS